MIESRRTVINGKFLRAGLTGVHRVARELLRAIDAIDPGGLPRFDALVPPGEDLPPLGRSMPTHIVGRVGGQAWEQIELPRAAHGDLILSLCNLAPILPHNAVTMIHDAQVFLTPESYSLGFRTWYRLVLRQAGRRHRRILTVSHFSRTQLVRFGVAPAERIRVIHNGVDHILRVASDRAVVGRLGLVPHGYAVALANTQAHKNIGLLLKTFAQPAMAGFTLVLVGGATAADFEALGHTVPPNIVFAGPVSDEALRGLYEEALCIAFPSLTEGFGLPPLEAMLLGCPAVIAPCGALPEVCGPHAIAVDPYDVDGWGTAIRALAADEPDRRTRSDAGRRHAETFTWDRAARAVLAVLDEVWNERS